MDEIRCDQCQRKLALAQYVRLDIKCPRCGTLNVLRASAADHSSPSPKPERPGASSTDGIKDDVKNGLKSVH
jgi:phage FluMu protein Com